MLSLPLYLSSWRETVNLIFATDNQLLRNVATITATKFGQWYRYMQTYIPHCMSRERREDYMQFAHLMFDC